MVGFGPASRRAGPGDHGRDPHGSGPGGMDGERPPGPTSLPPDGLERLSPCHPVEAPRSAWTAERARGTDSAVTQAVRGMCAKLRARFGAHLPAAGAHVGLPAMESDRPIVPGRVRTTLDGRTGTRTWPGRWQVAGLLDHDRPVWATRCSGERGDRAPDSLRRCRGLVVALHRWSHGPGGGCDGSAACRSTSTLSTAGRAYGRETQAGAASALTGGYS
jgi:hypothetical protein